MASAGKLKETVAKSRERLALLYGKRVDDAIGCKVNKELTRIRDKAQRDA